MNMAMTPGREEGLREFIELRHQDSSHCSILASNHTIETGNAQSEHLLVETRHECESAEFLIEERACLNTTPESIDGERRKSWWYVAQEYNANGER